MKVHLQSFVDRHFPEQANARQNKRFHPEIKSIRDHIYLSQKKHLKSKNDQDNLRMKVLEWQRKYGEDKFFCTLREETMDGREEVQKFTFAYQSKSQQRLLERYGKITLLDATYKTTRYALPLFFLCVKTNVNYQVVGMFLIQNETTDEIAAALQIFKDWNPAWNPEYVMTDFDEKEINAVERTFLGTKAYLCDFHREKSWTQWVNATEHGVRDNKDEVLARLRRIARSSTVKDYEDAVTSLKESTLWKKKPALQNWFSKQWIPHHEVQIDNLVASEKPSILLKRHNKVFLSNGTKHP